MDGMHDIGGVQGFGPIAVGDDGPPFHHPWEARMMAISEAVTNDPGWTIDWWRHVRELITPYDYLTRPYFDQWMQVFAALLIDSGLATVGEVARGVPTQGAPVPRLGPPMRPEQVVAASRHATDYRRPSDAAPAFRVGDEVTARASGAAGHTRLPRYARGRRGRIHAYRGVHLLPDAGARGVEQVEPLYTIVFDARALWPEAAGRRDRVFLDLWESYLEA